MIFKYTFIFLIIFFESIVSNPFENLDNHAVVVVPVADVSGRPLKTLKINKPPKEIYASLPCSAKNDAVSCLRVHQFLFNEIVKIEDETPEEVKCKIDNAFYLRNKEKISSFWTLKSNIKKLSDLGNDSSTKDVSLILPSPILDKNGNINFKNILVLILPWYEPKMNMHFSAGTRFLRESKLDTKDKYGVKAVNFNTNNIVEFLIPKKSALVENVVAKKNPKKLFVKTLEDWCMQTPHKIPYIRGGCSFVKTCKPSDFKLEEMNVYGKTESYWNRSNNSKPHTGMDCSSLILLAAQISGIPFLFKNSKTIDEHLKPLKNNEPLEAGDLIWMLGHIMVVGNTNRNEIIEARGYTPGYGIIHKINLSKLFLNVKDFKELANLHLKEQPLFRLDSQGKIEKKIPEFKILRFPS